MKPLTLATVIPWLMRLVAHMVGDFVLTLRREGLTYRVELCEAGEPAPTLTTELRPRSAPAADPEQLAIPGTEPTAAPDAAQAPAAVASTDDARAPEPELVGYTYGVDRAELTAAGPDAVAALKLRTGLALDDNDKSVLRWTTRTTDPRKLAGIRVWAREHKLNVYIDPDDPRPRILTVSTTVWREHHEGLLGAKYAWGFEGFNSSLRVAVVPRGGDLERILSYADAHGIDCEEDVAEDGQKPSAPQGRELPPAPAKQTAKGKAKTQPSQAKAKRTVPKKTPPAPPAERVVGLTAPPPDPDAKPYRRIAVPEADELAQGAPDHRAVGLVRGTWQTVLTRTSTQNASQWSAAVMERVDAGVRVRVYDRAGRCTWDSLDGGRP